MKNQYFGTAGDYGKFAKLCFLANNGIKIAVNWYLTPDDGSNDGKHITYFQDLSMRRYDEELFNLLSQMLESEQHDILKFESKEVIPNAIYYHGILDDEGDTRADIRRIRTEWHMNALEACEEAELVFLDPDNGAYDGKQRSSKDSIKYC